MGKLWTKEEDVILSKNWHRLTTKEIAEKLGKTEGSIRSRSDKIITIETRKCKKWTDIDDEILYDFYGRIEIEELSKKLRRTTRAIRDRITFLEGTKRPEIVSASFTVKDIAEIMGLDITSIHKWDDKGGIPFVKMSNRFMVNDELFWKWLKNNTERVKFHKVKDDMLMTYPEWYQQLVRAKKRELHLTNKKPKGEFFTTKEDILIWHLISKGKSHMEIAEELGRTEKSIIHRSVKIKEYKAV